MEVRKNEYILIISSKYEIVTVHTAEERIEHIYDLLKTINSDGGINEIEIELFYKYGILLGCQPKNLKNWL